MTLRILTVERMEPLLVYCHELRPLLHCYCNFVSVKFDCLWFTMGENILNLDIKFVKPIPGRYLIAGWLVLSLGRPN